MAERRTRKQLLSGLAEVFELPSDVVMDVARTTLVGTNRLAVENHRGIASFSSELIRIAVPGGSLVVKGRDLLIGTVTATLITVQGQIAGLLLEE